MYMNPILSNKSWSWFPCRIPCRFDTPHLSAVLPPPSRAAVAAVASPMGLKVRGNLRTWIFDYDKTSIAV